MQSASWRAFMDAAEPPDREDEDPAAYRNARLHCDRCGAFVSGRSPIRHEFPREPDIIEVDDDGNHYPMPGRPGAVVYDFPCKRCGGGHRMEEYV